MNIGQVIKKYRKERGFKQGEFSSACDISQTYLSLIENNQKEPNITTLRIIANKLNIPLPIMFFLSLDETDIPENKREVFKILEPSIKDMIKQIYTHD
ncbi:transcriptional regulator [Tenacibaculum discolor]|uniref:Transcriptional regulator n=1 Tax=Tenacibaculum discolor TaxID=361581 RepID=A0A2G1BU16_9FLAO|nr:helix-turn-helix transcriptional regulator [Tenacibaculum discolor]MDP2541542.1 helix-turn-helix transcriptional regulator [Tenacibaculum discolor]PHN97444.1 transcriptional regulator [Tenacibaculum discolor]